MMQRIHRMFAGVVVAAVTASASASNISAGFDLFASDPSDTFIRLNDLSPMLPLTPVPLMGVSVGPGNTDTIIERLQGIDFHSMSMGTIDVELVALSLQSVDPVFIMGVPYQLTIVSVPMMQTMGSMMITENAMATGGLFSATLPIKAVARLDEIGNGNQMLFPFNDELSISGMWSFTPDPMDLHTPMLPAGGFFPGIDPDSGQRVRTFARGALLEQAGGLPVPLPATLWAWAVGFGMLGASRFARKRHEDLHVATVKDDQPF